MPTPTDVLNVARSQIGYVEGGGAGGNSGNITKYWAELAPSLQGQPWCAGFVSWCFKHADATLPALPWNWGYSYVGAMVDAARKHGWVIPGPKPGAIVCFGTEHTEICGGVADAAGNFPTIGGNTSSGSGGSQVNGGGVYARIRNTNGSGIGPCTFVWPPVYGEPASTDVPQEEQNVTSFIYKGQLHAAYVDSKGLIRHRWNDDKGWHYEPRSSGCVPGATVAVESSYKDQLHLLTPRPDGSMQHDWFDGKNWGAEVVA